MTVQNVNHETSLGSRRRTSKLVLDLECSLAGDFVIKLDPEAEISSLNVGQNTDPGATRRGETDRSGTPGETANRGRLEDRLS